MNQDAERTRVTLWWVITTVVLVIRLVATIATVLLALGWVVAAIRDSIMNLFFWPLVGSAIALLISTYLYSYLRARYPRRNAWLP